MTKEVDKLRKHFGLRPLKSGIIDCICCGDSFESWDIRSNRLCNRCLESNALGEDYSTKGLSRAGEFSDSYKNVVWINSCQPGGVLSERE